MHDTDTTRKIQLFDQYQRLGWKLTPIPFGSKAPVHHGWNQPGQEGLPTGWNQNVGLLHVPSRTCTIDLDQLRVALHHLAPKYDIDLEGHLNAVDAVHIHSGNPDHAKALYQLPDDVEWLPSRALTHDGKHAINFRCATSTGLSVQDLLPGSIHPETGQEYQWAGRGAWFLLPTLPPELRLWWDDLNDPRTVRPMGDVPECNIEEVQSAMEVLDPDMQREGWLRVAMALHSTGEDLYYLFDQWSAGGAKYQGDWDTAAVWHSFSDPRYLDAAITLRSLFYLARKAGWRGNIDIQALFRGIGAPGASQVAGSVSPETSTQLSRSETAPPTAITYEQALDRAHHLNRSPAQENLDAIQQLLVDIAVAEWTATQQNRVLTEISDGTGTSVTVLRQDLIQIQRQLRRQQHPDVAADEPRWPLLNDADPPRPIPHIDTLHAICEYHCIGIRYNEMTHGISIVVPGQQWGTDDADNESLVHLKDLFVKYRMRPDRVRELVSAYATQHNGYHPFRDMLNATEWDGIDRWPMILDTVHTPHRKELERYLRRWLISVIAAVRGYGRLGPPRGVLVFTGPQAKGKTSWFKYLTPRGCFGEGLHLDPSSKDSLKQAVSWLIVELGELESTLKGRDLGRLKAHISNAKDILRLPYAAAESKWARRTVYCGTVNQSEFLQDQTGNTRFWPVNTVDFDLDTMQRLAETGEIVQFWAQVETWYQAGHTWLLDKEDFLELEEHNEQFRQPTYLEIELRKRYRLDVPRDTWNNWQTMESVCSTLGLDIRAKYDTSDLRIILQRITGQDNPRKTRMKGVQGRWWCMPPVAGLQMVKEAG